MTELVSKKFDWSFPIHDHVTSTGNIAAKLRLMDIDLSVPFSSIYKNPVLPEFGSFQVTKCGALSFIGLGLSSLDSLLLHELFVIMRL